MPLTTSPSGPRTRMPVRMSAGVAAAVGAGLLATAAPAAAATHGRHHARAARPAKAKRVPLGAWLHLGSTGVTVAEAQRALHIHAGGHFDRRTQRAVMAFQRRRHLIVDGVVGPQTWDTLFHIKAPPVVASPVAPAAPAASSTSYSSSSSSSDGASYASGGYSIPNSIVQCESGGNYSAVNASSGAGGAYQILPSTWRAYGGQGLPEDASPAEQDHIAAEIYARQGGSAWSC